MSRQILDDALLRWEVYATAGRGGFSSPARLVFRCLDDAGERARALTIDGDKSDAEKRVSESTDGELQEMLREATELD